MRLTTRRHGSFVAAFAAGLLVAILAWVQGVAPVFCLLSGVNLFFVLYLGLMAGRIRTATAAELRRHAAEEDEGVALILFLALVAVVASVAAIVVVLNSDNSGLHARIAALVSLPLGWATVHVLAAFHYAHLHYRGPAPGMVFPGKGEPDAWDFLYASFTIGMTAQVSDMQLETRALRKAVLAHGVASFFYNTCILALAVNAAVTAGQ
jgi:uncharacterized membrane protein